MQDNYIGSLDSNKLTTPREDAIPRSIMSISKCFTVVNSNDGRKPSATLLFRMKINQSQNCNGIANVFQTPFPMSPTSFIVSPTNGTTCEVIVLNSQTAIEISPIASYDNNASVYVQSAVNQRKLFQTNVKDAALWKNVVIYAAAISLKVFGTIVFNIASSDGTIKNSGGYQKGIFVSPKYTGFSMVPAYSLYTYTANDQKTQTFIVRELLNENDIVLKIDRKSYDFSKNSSIKVLSNKFELLCTQDNGFLIEYYLNDALNITLDYNTTKYALWLDNLNPYQAITTCGLKNIDKLELFYGGNLDLSKYQLYDSQYFYYLVKNFTNYLESSSDCFTLYNNGNNQATFATLLFRLAKTQSFNCASSNVFSLDTDSPNTFSSSANSYGSCEMIILAPNLPWPNLNIQSIRSSPNKSITLVSTINQKVIANISASEILFWNDFNINTPALSVIIPPSSYFSLNLNSTRKIPIIINKCFKGQKGVIASPSYNGLPQTLESSIWFYQFQCPNLGINFYVNNLANDTQVFTQDNDKYGNKTFNSYDNLISSGNVDIYYSESPTYNDAGFLITYTFVDASLVNPTTEINKAPNPIQSIVYDALTIIFFACLTKKLLI